MTETMSEIGPRVVAKIAAMSADPRAIHPDICGGLVTLYGCAEADEADQLCAAIRRIAGVDAVENRITVR